MMIKVELLNISLKIAITTSNNFYLGIQFYTVIYSNYSTWPSRKDIHKVLVKSKITFDSILSNISKFQNIFYFSTRK